jgi:hypothetical protein
MASMGAVVKGMLLLVAMLVAALLQGCGCTSDAISKCSSDNPVPTGSDMSAFCTYVEGTMKCWKDASCCDHDDVKPLINSMKTYESAPYSCTMPSCS